MLLGLYLEHNDFSLPFMQTRSGEGYANFFAGVLLYELYENVLKHQKRQTDYCVAGALAAVITGSLLFGTDHFWGDCQIVILLISAMLIYLSASVSTFRRLLEFRPLLRLAGISTELYLLHSPVLKFLLPLLRHCEEIRWTKMA